jgi:nitrogenase molybdenum-iron protein NifN
MSTITPIEKRKPLRNRKKLQVNPVKMSQPTGATLAFMGIKGCLPLMHGAIGCASFTKVLMTRHFCEPIALRNTAVTEVASVLDGGDAGVAEAVRNLLKIVTPEVIGLFSTGLTDAKGDDLEGIARGIDYPIVWADTPDYLGGLESGWAAVAMSFIKQRVEPCRQVDANKVLLLPHVSLQPLEIEDLKHLLASLGLEVYALPDLSTSLDGHLGENQASLCQGGIRLDEIRQLASAATVITIGESMRAAGECFVELHPQTRHLHVAGLMGLQASDDFLSRISEITNIEPDERVKRWRQRLRDAMIDAHFHIGRSQFILAGEPDRIADMARALAEVGGKIRAVVASTPSKALEGLPASHVMVGDLEDVEAMLDEADVLICNMHGQRIALAHDKVYIPRGYPIYEQIGVQMKVDTLYRGGNQFLIDVANAVIDARLRKHH